MIMVTILLIKVLLFSSYLKAGVRVGLARNDALKLAAQTVKGAAEMVLSTGSSPAVLKDQGMNTFSNCQIIYCSSINASIQLHVSPLSLFTRRDYNCRNR